MTKPDKRASDDYSELFHYTSMDALRNIYATRSFWATHFTDLDDASEFSHFTMNMRNFILPIIGSNFHELARRDPNVATMIHQSGGLDRACEHDADMFSNLMFRDTFGEEGLSDTFLCSFCYHFPETYEAENGLLSQWRGYGAGGGVAIVLDTFKMEALMEKERDVYLHPVNHIGNVCYDDCTKRHRLDEKVHEKQMIRPIFDLFPKILKDFYTNARNHSAAVQKDIGETLVPYIFGTTLLKHHAFHEENEIRIVVSLSSRNPGSVFFSDKKIRKPIRFRRKGDGECRYIELFGIEPIPIKRIIVGPSRFQIVTLEDVARLVAGTDIQVVRSQTPFRG